MKNILTTLAMLISANFTFAQSSFQFLEKGSITPAQLSYTISTELENGFRLELACKNNSGTTKSTKVKIHVIAKPSSCDNELTFCDGVMCHSGGIYKSEEALDINGGQTISSALSLTGKPKCAEPYIIQATLYDVNNVKDSVSVLLNIDFFAASIDKISTLKYVLSNAVPNPTNENAIINYAFATQPKAAILELYNVIGTKVNEYNIEGTEGNIKMNVDELPSGIYFYSLLVDGNKISTQKLIVRD
jgi:hypothetical protein